MKTLTLIDKAFLLKKTRFFSSLDLDLLLTIADKMDVGFFKAGSPVFKEGQEAHRLFFLVEGDIRIQKQGKLLGELKSGEFFGDEALFNEKQRGYEAICTSDSQLLSLSRAHLLSIIAECPSVAISFLEEYTALLDFRARSSY